MRAAERRCALRGRGCTSHHMCSSVNSKSACSRFAVPEENRRRAPATRKQASTHGPARPKAQPRAIAQAQRHALSSQSRFPVDLPRSQSQSTPETPPPAMQVHTGAWSATRGVRLCVTPDTTASTRAAASVQSIQQAFGRRAACAGDQASALRHGQSIAPVLTSQKEKHSGRAKTERAPTPAHERVVATNPHIPPHNRSWYLAVVAAHAHPFSLRSALRPPRDVEANPAPQRSIPSIQPSNPPTA